MIRVLQGGRFLRERAGLSAAERADVDTALRQLPAAFGQMHVHTGLGIRRLRRNWFECRAGLYLRVVFFVEGEECRCYTVGNHGMYAISCARSELDSRLANPQGLR